MTIIFQYFYCFNNVYILTASTYWRLCNAQSSLEQHAHYMVSTFIAISSFSFALIIIWHLIANIERVILFMRFCTANFLSKLSLLKEQTHTRNRTCTHTHRWRHPKEIEKLKYYTVILNQFNSIEEIFFFSVTFVRFTWILALCVYGRIRDGG